MRRFQGYRPNPPAEYLAAGVANPPDDVQYEGVVFTDGTVVCRWQTEFRSHSVWTSWDDFYRVHGHPEYGTRIEWLDSEPPSLLEVALADEDDDVPPLPPVRAPHWSDDA